MTDVNNQALNSLDIAVEYKKKIDTEDPHTWDGSNDRALEDVMKKQHSMIIECLSGIANNQKILYDILCETALKVNDLEEELTSLVGYITDKKTDGEDIDKNAEFDPKDLALAVNVAKALKEVL